MKKILPVLLIVPNLLEAAFIDTMFEDKWTEANKYIYPLANWHIKKRLSSDKMNHDEHANFWAIDYVLLNNAYIQNMGLNTDIASCKARKYNDNPSWIDGPVRDPVIGSDGIPVYTVLQGELYNLKQRDLSKRGKERLRDHYFSWIIPGESIVHNPKKEDPDTQYKFSKDVTVFNLALVEEWKFTASWGGSYSDSGEFYGEIPKFKFAGGDALTRYSCNYYRVKAVKNTAPTFTSEFKQIDAPPHPDYHNLPFAGWHIGITDRESPVEELTVSWKFEFKDGRIEYASTRGQHSKTLGEGAAAGRYPRPYNNALFHPNTVKKLTVTVSDGKLSTTKISLF
ncbi:MAG: hypothetical protein CVV11_03830 [Gammaproteobacteria bacterium HGW-Gammaproteobacteria-15]|nr:MAG: hypothetical protein CVV11_03830 [Gammaproteobacteria bacterium HGW-Gammaproteobacteria-15]